MYEKLGEVRLKSGEVVDAGVVMGPDEAWAGRVETLLGHKGEMWRWGNTAVLREPVGVEAYFYLLHRDGTPFANMMTIETAGVGVFGHVYTKPEDRRQHAASKLMALQMAHFRARGGRALFLGTGYDSAAYHIYRGEGFASVEPKSGTMAYYADSQTSFERAYFAEGDASDSSAQGVAVERLDWPHWPASPAAFLDGRGGVVRSVVLRVIGRGSTESGVLGLLRDEVGRKARGEETRTAVAVNRTTTAVVGLATSGMDPTWPRTALLDVHCHPRHWSHAAALIDRIELPAADRVLAFSDYGWSEKEKALEDAGFRRTVVLRGRAARDRAGTGFVDVQEWERGI